MGTHLLTAGISHLSTAYNLAGRPWRLLGIRPRPLCQPCRALYEYGIQGAKSEASAGRAIIPVDHPCERLDAGTRRARRAPKHWARRPKTDHLSTYFRHAKDSRSSNASEPSCKWRRLEAVLLRQPHPPLSGSAPPTTYTPLLVVLRFLGLGHRMRAVCAAPPGLHAPDASSSGGVSMRVGTGGLDNCLDPPKARPLPYFRSLRRISSPSLRKPSTGAMHNPFTAISSCAPSEAIMIMIQHRQIWGLRSQGVQLQLFRFSTVTG